MVYETWNADRAREIIAQHRGLEGPMLPILHALQEAFGYIDAAAEPLIADALNLSRAEVHGVVTFYHDFRRAPAGRHVVKLCRAEACQAAGGDALAAHASARLGMRDRHHLAGRRRDARAGLLPRPVRHRPVGDDRWRAWSAGSTRGASTRCWRRCCDDRCGFRTRAMPARVAVGADEVAAAFRAAAAARNVVVGHRAQRLARAVLARTAGRGRNAAGRIGYGPVDGGRCRAACWMPCLPAAERIRCGSAVVDDLPCLKRQTRLTFARCGDHRSAFARGLSRATAASRAWSGAGARARTPSSKRSRNPACAAAAAPAFRPASSGAPSRRRAGPQKYIVCNADEGDSGTFADRMIMEGDPFVLIEGMTIAGIAVGATKGYVYIRSEYPARDRRHDGGDRDRPPRAACSAPPSRARPMPSTWKCAPAPAPMSAARKPRCWKAWKAGAAWCGPSRRCRRTRACSASPTVINNVLSLATVPFILAEGAARYRDFGMGRSRGTMPIQLAGNVRHGGLFETAFGITLGELVDDIGGGTASGRPVRAVQVGGPLGAYFPRALFDTPFDYEAFAARDGLIGHGGIVVFDDTVDMARQARFAMEFCAIESCGKCTPCRIGSTRGVETLDRIIAGDRRRGEPRRAGRPLPHHEVRLAVRARRLHALSGDERAHPFPGRFRRTAAAAPGRGMKEIAMSLVHEIDYGTPRSKAERSVTLTIDGQSVTVPEGTSIMRAAMEMGTAIPKLCATDMLEAFGSCRLCLVEIDGRAGTPASCTTPVAAGMVVRTQTERLKRLRKGVMELYISDHPLDCLTCAANGDCELQDMAGAVGLRDVRYGYNGDKHPNPGKDESNPYFTYDPSKCIVCSRCVRACEEVQGTFALTIAGRGFDSVVSPGMEEAFLASECVSCGACVQACPTATLTEKSVIDIGQPEHSVVTTCAYCGVGCSFKAEMRGEEVVRMVPYKDGKANRGHSCVKGRFAWGYATHRERILKPMIRDKITDPWREVSWDEAIGRVASEFRRIQATLRRAGRSAASPRRAAPTRKPSWCRS